MQAEIWRISHLDHLELGLNPTLDGVSNILAGDLLDPKYIVSYIWQNELRFCLIFVVSDGFLLMPKRSNHVSGSKQSPKAQKLDFRMC